uniref:Plexin b2b n=1 Tax=Sparus aurata TaxID=8175 RepID=A0A671YXT0_SPAAU
MASWVSLLLFLFCKSVVRAQEEFTSETPINNVVQDTQTGRIYLGAVNSIYQLGPSLQKQARAETGPKEDSRTCTPPASACQDTKPMPNLNKLLLVHPSNGTLIVCGSRYRGICSLLNLTNVEQQIYYLDTKGERTYVASIEDNVNVVGVMSTYKNEEDTFSVFVVGKGYGSADSTKLISTRILQDYGDWVVFESIIEASTVQTTPFAPKYLHDFRLAFKEGDFIYFLFSRTLDGTDNKNLTFVSRLCENDPHYYSHTELQLNCGPNNRYNKVQAAYVASPGKELVMSWDKVLFMVASPDEDDNDSALCMYPLNIINEQLVDIISACYSDSAEIFPFHGMHQYLNIIFHKSCGADFLPSPLASKPRFALKADAMWTTQGLLTAVAVAVENDHTVAFLGNSQGEVLKVDPILSTAAENGMSFTEKSIFIEKAYYVNLVSPQVHFLIIFHVLTPQITKVPVQTCLQQKDCQSCVELRDPYCGWCVLEGRCTRRSECRRAEEKNGWLWSPKHQCVKIISFHPPNLSCKKTQKVQSCFSSLSSLSSSLFLSFCSLLLFLSLSLALQNTNSLECGAKCPQFENPDPGLIPVGYKTRISFEGINLDLYQVKIIQCFVLFPSAVTLYNCSVGREDCSLCKNADTKYSCVWCAKQKACVYEKLCNPDQQGSEYPYNTDCPDPLITDIIPRFGPMQGGISITIKGSNLGIHRQDIKSITVAGEPCVHQEEKYSVSTSFRVHVNPCRAKHEQVFMMYLATLRPLSLQNPRPEAVKPSRGPKAGGTLITISGLFLDTGSKGFLFSIIVIPTKAQFCFNSVSSFDMCCFVNLSLQGRGFSKAMTNKEAQAFVGDVPCLVNTLQDDKLFLDPPSTPPRARSRRHRRDTRPELLDLTIKFGKGEWVVGSVQYEKKNDLSLYIIIPAVIVPMLLIIAISVYCYRRKSQQAEREYEKVKHQLENLEESVRDRCKKEFTDLMIEMEDHTNELSEGRIPFLDYKTYTDRVFFLPSKDGANDVMITGKLDIPEARRATVTQALNQFSNLLNSKTFLINFIRTLERSHDFNARAKVYFASLLTVALHGKLEYYTDIMRTLLLELMGDYVHSKNPKLMLRRSETVVERMLCNWMSICLYQFLKDSAGEPLYKLFRAIKHQIEKGPVDARVKKAKYTLNDTGLLGDDVEYSVLTLQVLVQSEGPDVTSVKVLNCDTISQVKEKIIEQVYRNQPYSQRPKVDSVTLEWRPGSTGQILSDLDLTSQKEGRWKRINTLAHYNVRDNATLVLSRVLHTHQNYDQNQENHEERNALLEDDKVFHLVRPADELDEIKSKRGSIKDKSMTKAITEIYLTRLLSVKGTLQQFVDDFFRSVLCSGAVVPPAVKYFFDFLDEQALKHNNVDEETIHIWKTNSLPLRFWVNILKNPHFIFDVHVSEVVDASLSVIAQTFMDACTKSEHKLSRDSPSNKLLYAKEISTYKKMVDDYYKGIRQMVPVSDQDMNTHLAEVSRSHTDKLNTQVALHQLYQYASKYYDGIILSLEEDPAAQSKQLTLRLQQIAAALENKVTDL